MSYLCPWLPSNRIQHQIFNITHFHNTLFYFSWSAVSFYVLLRGMPFCFQRYFQVSRKRIESYMDLFDILFIKFLHSFPIYLNKLSLNMAIEIKCYVWSVWEVAKQKAVIYKQRLGRQSCRNYLNMKGEVLHSPHTHVPQICLCSPHCRSLGVGWGGAVQRKGHMHPCPSLH